MVQTYTKPGIFPPKTCILYLFCVLVLQITNNIYSTLLNLQKVSYIYFHFHTLLDLNSFNRCICIFIKFFITFTITYISCNKTLCVLFMYKVCVYFYLPLVFLLKRNCDYELEWYDTIKNLDMDNTSRVMIIIFYYR